MDDVEREVTETSDGSGKATASMSLGIASLMCACGLPPLGLLLAIVGIVLGMMSMKSANKSFALTGVITSAFSVILSILVMAGLAALFLSPTTHVLHRSIEADITEPPPDVFQDPPEEEEGR